MRSALQRGLPGHVNKLISCRDQQALLHIHDNALRYSSRWWTHTHTHTIKKASLFGSVFFSFPALRLCVGLAGSLLLWKIPLLATASIPLHAFSKSLQTSEYSLRWQPVLWGLPQHIVGLCEKTTGGDESTFSEQVLCLAFPGDHFEQAFSFSSLLCHPPHPFFSGKVLGYES